MKTSPSPRDKEEALTEELSPQVKEFADKVYAIGFKNGQIEMKNKVLKSINRDWNLVGIKKPMDLIMTILKKVNKLSVSGTRMIKKI